MGLFDFLKKSTESYKEELSLEMLLQKAAGEPAYRAEFYKRLLSDDLFVITRKSHLQPGSHFLEKDTEIQFVAYDDGGNTNIHIYPKNF